MLIYFARQDLAQRFTGNALGIAWAVFAPLLQLALFAFVFGYIFRQRVPGLEGAGYVTFLALGMWPWFAFAEAVNRGMSTLTDQAGLLAKVAVPTQTLIAARVATAFGLHATGFLVVLVALALVAPGLHLHLLPAVLPAWIGLAVIAYALASLLAHANVFVRDLQQIVAYAVPALMFLSPVLYSVEMVPEPVQPWLALNPLSALIDGARAPLLYGDVTAAFVPAPWLAAVALLAIAALWVRRLRAHVVDFL